ncbi:hypothetical protein HHI36_023700 [Cryptolaemus montrouzieri]|uniref:Uncharacterized protein n=1 Tax=Cryptolaemus montrouzieri TaxID=559131 RepID=A0ABD2PHP0_9CUCU
MRVRGCFRTESIDRYEMLEPRLISFILVSSILISKIVMQDENEDIPNPIRFPYGGPFMGIFVTLSLPLGLKEEDIFFAYNMEANYVLPENQTSFSYPPLLVGRSITRKSIFNLIEKKLSNLGYPGYPCMVRLICDNSVHPVKFLNGVVGDLLHILLTPSSSVDDDSPPEYENAEIYGLKNGNCEKYNSNCSYSIIDLFSTLYDLIV